MSAEVISTKKEDISLSKNTGISDPFSGTKVEVGKVDIFNKPKKTQEDKIIEANEQEVSTIDIPELGSDIDLFSKGANEKIAAEAIPQVLEEEIEKEKSEEETVAEVAAGIKESEKETLSPEETTSQIEEEVTTEDDDVVDNVFYHLGHELLNHNVLPEDYELKEDVTGKEIFDVYKETIVETAYAEIQNKVLQDLSEVYNPTTLEYAKLLYSGTDPNTLYQANVVASYANLDIENTELDDKLKVVKSYYEDRNFKEKEIKKFIQDIELEETNVDEVVKEAKDHFKVKYDSILSAEKEAAENRTQQQIAYNTELRKSIESIIDSGTAAGVPISDKRELRKAVFEADQVVTLEGTDYQATQMDLFRLSFQNDPEVQMASFLHWLYKDDISNNIKEEAKAEAEEELLKGYRKSVEKSTNNMIKGQIASKLKTQKGNSKTLMLDGRGNKLTP